MSAPLENEHLGDEIELYALGDVAAHERLRIEAHLAKCAACTAAVGDAEAALGELAGLLPAYRAPRRMQPRPAWFRYQALAAAFVAGLLLAGGSFAAFERSQVRPDGDVQAQVAMTHAHFVHIPLAGVEPGAPPAKVIYPKDRAWLYAIVGDASRPYRLVSVESGGTRDLGTLAGHGASSSLFVPNPGKVGELELLSGEGVVAKGALQ